MARSALRGISIFRAIAATSVRWCFPVLVSVLGIGASASRCSAVEGGARVAYERVADERVADERVPTWDAPVDTVEVQAGRPDLEEWVWKGSTFADVVPLGDASPLRDLGDVLDESVSVHVHRFGGLGSFSLASVRGSAPGQVAVVLDGFALGNATSGVVDLSSIPVAQLERAEIYRGSLSPPFSGAPAAATIALTSETARSSPAELTIGAGSFGTRVINGSWGGHSGIVHGFATIGHRSSDGDFRYEDRNGTPHNGDDDREVARRNNRFDEVGILARGSVLPSDSWRFDYTVSRVEKASGIPGTESRQTTRVRYDLEQLRQQAAVTWTPRYPQSMGHWGRPRAELAFQDARSKDRFDNRAGEAGVGRAHFDNATEQRGGWLALRLPLLPARQILDLRMQADEESFTPSDLLRDVRGFTRHRRNRTLTANDRMLLFGDRLTLEAQHRWVGTRDNYGGPVIFGTAPAAAPTRRFRETAPSFGARLEIARGVAVKGTRGRFLRTPAFAELFGENGVQDGNPELRPESGLQWDVGVSVDVGDSGPLVDLGACTAYFESTVDDKIVLLQNSQRTSKAFNLDRTWIRGVETELHGSLRLPAGQAVSVRGHVVWQEARDVGESRTYRGKWLPNLPETEGFVETRWSGGPWVFRHGVSTRTAAYRDRYNTQGKRTEGYALHDLSAERSFFAERVRWRLEVQNLADRRVQDIDGFPLPGRSVLFETTWVYR